MSLLKTSSCVLEFIPSTCSMNPETTLACGIFAVTTQPSIVDVYDLRNTKTHQMCCSDTIYLWKHGVSLDTINYPTGVWQHVVTSHSIRPDTICMHRTQSSAN